VGAAFPINKYWEMEGYFDSQLDTGKGPNRETRAIAIVTTLYF